MHLSFYYDSMVTPEEANKVFKNLESGITTKENALEWVKDLLKNEQDENIIQIYRAWISIINDYK